MGSSRPEVKEWRRGIVPPATQRALDAFSNMAWLKRSRWYLAGGTALALHVGHRQSVDLDFFTPEKDFSTGKLLGHFAKNEWHTDIAREGTVYGKFLGAKVSFISYPFFKAKEPPAWYGSVRVLAPADIAVMKIIAVSQRGRKRDFVDLYWYVRHRENLAAVLRRLPEQYPTVAHDYHHILKSIMYFRDAEGDPLPNIFFNADWRTIKRYFMREVPKVAKQLLRL